MLTFLVKLLGPIYITRKKPCLQLLRYYNSFILSTLKSKRTVTTRNRTIILSEANKMKKFLLKYFGPFSQNVYKCKTSNKFSTISL